VLIYEDKVDGTTKQYNAIEEAMRITQFIRNKCLHKWMDEEKVSKNDLQCYCVVLASEYSFASKLCAQARQAAADRAWFAIDRFYEKRRLKKLGRAGLLCGVLVSSCEHMTQKRMLGGLVLRS
jgi:putative transposase